jgi:hypothetical protein|tara:strand:+ start:47 stop:352 length:306 start_codon:yes stop_codon:yes gene_type:complete
MSDRLKEIYIEALSSHDWNYELQPDSKFDAGVEQRENIRSIVAKAYELEKDPAKIFYQYCPEHLYDCSSDYGIRTPWEELKLHMDILQEEKQEELRKHIRK